MHTLPIGALEGQKDLHHVPFFRERQALLVGDLVAVVVLAVRYFSFEEARRPARPDDAALLLLIRVLRPDDLPRGLLQLDALRVSPDEVAALHAEVDRVIDSRREQRGRSGGRDLLTA